MGTAVLPGAAVLDFMRIIGGVAGGRLLRAPKGLAVRPTPDRVRQAIFNRLGDLVVDARVLDLFAGTGALSLECLSRGSLRAVCIEKVWRHADVLKQNLHQTGIEADRLEVHVQDVSMALTRLVAQRQQFNLIFADPPFGEKNVGRPSTSWAQRLLENAHLPRLLSADGWFVLGHARHDALRLPPAWLEVKCLKHGDSVVRFLQVADLRPQNASAARTD